MTPEGLNRRTMLRNVLIAGSVLYLPMLAGCDRKSSEPETSSQPSSEAVPAPGSSAVAVPPDTLDEGPEVKLTKSAVKYQDQPEGDSRCDNCLHFLPDTKTCKLVEGPVSPQGWCAIWIAKTT